MTGPRDAAPTDVHEPGPAALGALLHRRHSTRAAFDPTRRPSDDVLDTVLEAARWAPTAHNMQNFEIIVVDDPATLADIGRVPSRTSPEFVRENYAELSFSEAELIAKGTGLLARMFPESWLDPDGPGTDGDTDVEHGYLDETMRSSPLVLIVVYDTTRRAPASEGDFLGVISLGCVMQSMWLAAEAAGASMQIMSAFSADHVQEALRTILGIPGHLDIAFACRMGYPSAEPGPYLRVRREVDAFVHRNSYPAAGT